MIVYDGSLEAAINFLNKIHQMLHFIEKINCGFEASVVDDRRLEATINFGFAALRLRGLVDKSSF